MEQTYDASRDQHLLAAYIFGYRSRTIWLWHDLFWQTYFVHVDTTADPDDGLQNGPSLAAEEIEWTIDINYKSIHPNAVALIQKPLRQIAESPYNAIKTFDSMDHEGRARFLRFLRVGTPMRQEWERLKTLADEAFDKDSRLSPYFDLGKAIGAYELAINQIPDLPEYLHQSADISLIAETANRLPDDSLREMPLLAECLALWPTLVTQGPRAFFMAMLQKLDDLAGRPHEGLDRLNPQTTLVKALHDEICSALEEMPLLYAREATGEACAKISEYDKI